MYIIQLKIDSKGYFFLLFFLNTAFPSISLALTISGFSMKHSRFMPHESLL